MAFPTTPVLDSFNRADENPLGNGTWTAPALGDSGSPQVLSNQCAPDGAVANYNAAVWSSAFGADQEAYFTLAVKGTGTTFVYLASRMTSETLLTWAGYTLQIPTGTNSVWTLNKVVAGWSTIIGTTATQLVSAGDSVGCSIVGTTFTMQYKAAAGSWTALNTVTNTAISGSGKIGFEWDGLDAARRLDDFGGGNFIERTLPFNAIPFIPHGKAA